MDGLSHCRKASETLDKHLLLKQLQDDAMYKIKPAGCSEWFIPSSGQLILMFKNLSGIPYSETGDQYTLYSTNSYLTKMGEVFIQAGAESTPFPDQSATSASTQRDAGHTDRFVFYTSGAGRIHIENKEKNL
ncbi:MAG: hypothetical protein LUE99_00675 [Bacteroides sp.]|nr:hypothetical protein [Bacteroides sp.]